MLKHRLLVTAVLLPIFLIILLYLPSYILAAFISIVCAISAYELQRAIGAKEHERLTIYVVLTAIVIPVGAYFDKLEIVLKAVLLVLLCIVFLEAIPVYKMKRQITFAQIMTTIFGGALIPFMLSSLINLINMKEGRIFVMLPVIVSFSTDAGAYFVGMFMGKRKSFPLISPNKTVEGHIGGFLIGTIAIVTYGAIIYFSTLHDVSFPVLIIYGIVGAAVSELGDLVFSLIKREHEVKDFGNLLPGHGGMLDRVDSMMFAAQTMYLLVTMLPAISIN